MKAKQYFINLLLILFLFGCASTRMTSFKDPDYLDSKFERILVVANTNDLEDRQNLESGMVEEFTEIGVFALESFKLFPPTRDLSEEDKVDLLLANNIDGFITIDVGESGVNSVYVPQTGSTTKKEGRVNVYGNSATYKEKSKTTYQGGYTLNKPWAEFETRLYDVTNGNMAWIATSFTGGNAYANKNTLIGSYCSTTIEKLVEEKLVNEKITD